MAMDYFLTDEQKMIKELACKVAREKILPVRDRYEETGEFPWEIVKALHEADLWGVYLPSEYGGFGGGVTELCLVIEELCMVDAAIPLCFAATALGALPIMYFGTPEQKKRWLTDIATGPKVAALGLTETQAGSDMGMTKTTATKDGNDYVINGAKNFITNGGEAQYYSVLVSTAKGKGARGSSMILVEKGVPGLSFGKKEHKMGIRASSTTQIFFDNVRVPQTNLIGKEGEGFIVALKTLDRSRPGIAAQAIGLAQGALSDTLNYARQRHQFGQPIASFQAIQHMLADMATQVEAARALMMASCRMIDAHPDVRSTRESAMTKLFASDMAMKVTTDAVQIYGGYGYMREFPVEKRMRDAKITQIYEGANQIQRNEIAYALIKEAAAAEREQQRSA